MTAIKTMIISLFFIKKNPESNIGIEEEGVMTVPTFHKESRISSH